MKTITSNKVKQTFKKIQKHSQAQMLDMALREFEDLCSDSHEQRKAIVDFRNFLNQFKNIDATDFAFCELGYDE